MSEIDHGMREKYPSLAKFAVPDADYVESHDGREQELLAYIRGRADFEQLCNNPGKVLQAIDDFAYNHDFLINIGEDKAGKLRGLLTEVKPQVLVELGGYIGYSAIVFAAEARQYAKDAAQVHIWSLEVDATCASVAKELVGIAGLSDLVTIVVGTAEKSLPKLKADQAIESIDFLFLDHVEDLYEQDFKICEDLGFLQKGAYIVADNVLRPGAPRYREFVRKRDDVKSWALQGMIMPGEFMDEMEVSQVL